MKLVIFDCDGTLLDSQHMIVAAMNAAFSTAGLALPASERVRGVIGLSLEGAVERLLESSHRYRAPAIAADYKAAFRELRTKRTIDEPLYPGIRDMLDRLAARPDLLLAIATGKSRRGVDAVMEREGLGGHFLSIQTADDHPSKPHPSMIYAAMAETGAGAHDTLMIGDTTFDVEMARHAGVRGVGVAWGYHPAEALRQAGACRICGDSLELGAGLDELLSLPEAAA